MIPRNLEYSHVFNLGDYETERITLTVDLDETEDLDEAFRTIKAQVFHLHEEGQLLEDSKKIVESEETKNAWDPEKIPWRSAEGVRGPYFRYPRENEKAEATQDYQNMVADLKAHSDKLTRDGYFYWLFTDGATVGRKPAKKK